jgi:hypothetical protein
MSLPLDESARQRALDTYRLLDTLPEPAYEDIVRLAASICDVPVALISLIDRDRQWFKARIGLDFAESPRDQAFCDHAIRDPAQLLEVPDALEDARFVGNPLVTGATGIRFYAGVPLVTPGGAAIGTVCVIDQRPRALSDNQREALAALARVTMNLLEGRQRERESAREALLAGAAGVASPAAAAAAPPIARPCTVAIIEVQDYAGVVHARGERAVERALAKLEALVEAELQHVHGDGVSRVSGGAEVIAALYGDHAADAVPAIRAQLPAFESENGFRVLLATAAADSAGESPSSVFVRADEALSRLKDAEATRRAAAHPA